MRLRVPLSRVRLVTSSAFFDHTGFPDGRLGVEGGGKLHSLPWLAARHMALCPDALLLLRSMPALMLAIFHA
jgi:hypothetical protein